MAVRGSALAKKALMSRGLELALNSASSARWVSKLRRASPDWRPGRRDLACRAKSATVIPVDELAGRRVGICRAGPWRPAPGYLPPRRSPRATCRLPRRPRRHRGPERWPHRSGRRAGPPRRAVGSGRPAGPWRLPAGQSWRPPRPSPLPSAWAWRRASSAAFSVLAAEALLGSCAVVRPEHTSRRPRSSMRGGRSGV